MLAVSIVGVFESGFLSFAGVFFFFAFIRLIAGMCKWFRDIILERTYLGFYTSYTVRNMRVAIALFLASEVAFFAAFF